MEKRIVMVVSVEVSPTTPTTLLIDAEGMTATAGWTDPRLSPHSYELPPKDGMQEYSFVATPPSDPQKQIPSKIRATAVMNRIPEWLRGVRICASVNQVVVSGDWGAFRTVEATGESDTLSFGEALQDAVDAIKTKMPASPDHLLKLKVSEIGGEYGGVDGRTRLFVTVSVEVRGGAGAEL